MFLRVRKIYRVTINAFGILGAFGCIWYGITNATELGVTVVFGKERGVSIQTMIISSIDFVKAYLPYVAFFGGIIVLLFIITVPIIDFVLKRRGKQTKENESPEAIVAEIGKLTRQLEETLKTKEK